MATRTGLISACAGPTFAHFISVLRVRAHLRVRGADLTMRMPNSVPAGSSPRARGRHTLDRHSPPLRGLISACAGPTLDKKRPRNLTRAHLRVRGADPCGVLCFRALQLVGKRLPSLSLPRVGR